MKGNITISRPRPADYIQIEFGDELSGRRFLRAKVKLADFAEALTGLGYVDCEFELTPDEVGKVRETKTERIQADGYSLTDEQKIAILAPYEVDGWRAQRSDLGNHHKGSQGVYSVAFVRFVPVIAPQEAES